MRVISIAGKDGQGKSTLARGIRSKVPGAKILSFATGVRESVIESGRVTREEAYAKPTSDKVRQILREEGAFGRGMTPDYWALELGVMLAHQSAQGVPLVVIDDTRFLSEIKYLDNWGAFHVFIGDLPTQEEMTLESFKELPQVRELCHLHVARRGGTDLLKSIF